MYDKQWISNERKEKNNQRRCRILIQMNIIYTEKGRKVLHHMIYSSSIINKV